MTTRGFVACALIALCSASQSEPPATLPLEGSQRPNEQASAPQPKPELDQRGTRHSPLVVEALESDSDATEKKSAAEHRKDEATRNQWAVSFTGGMFIVALFQAAFFVWQLRLMKQATADSGKTAAAAKESADISKESLRTAQRAYVGIPQICSTFNYGNSEDLYSVLCSAEIRNYGLTPALSAEAAADFVRCRPEQAQSLEHVWPQVDETPARHTIFPGTLVRAGRNTLTFDELLKVYDDKLAVLAFARCDYTDIFRQRHTTTVCMRMHIGIDPRKRVKGNESHLFFWQPRANGSYCD